METKSYILYKMADAISKERGIGIYEAMCLPESEFWNAGITINL